MGQSAVNIVGIYLIIGSRATLLSPVEGRENGLKIMDPELDVSMLYLSVLFILGCNQS